MANIVIKKFSSPTCNPCKVLANYLGDVDLTYHGAELQEIDVTDPSAQDDLEKYGIMNVPVLIYERNGLEMSRSIGLVPVEQIIDQIQYAKEAK